MIDILEFCDDFRNTLLGSHPCVFLKIEFRSHDSQVLLCPSGSSFRSYCSLDLFFLRFTSLSDRPKSCDCLCCDFPHTTLRITEQPFPA